MVDLNEHLKELITAYFFGSLENEDSRELLTWLNEDAEHKKIFKQYVRELYAMKVAENWSSVRLDRAKDKVFRKLSRHRELRRVYMGVAAILLLFVSSALFYSIYQASFHVLSEKRVYSDLVQHHEHQQAILSIDNEKQIVLNATREKVIASDSLRRVFIDDSCVMRYENLGQAPSGKIPVHTLEVPRGSEFRVTLSDGTKVWMNAGSKLIYPETFSGDCRCVTLSGEAYFEVAHDAGMPFIVTTSDMDLTVLGTSFNVKAYEENEYVVTTLITGRIRQKYVKGAREIVLEPAEQSVYQKSDGLLQVTKVDVAEVIGWKEGRLIMKNKPLHEIFKELARWYDFEVEYKSERLQFTRFYLNIDRYDDIKMVLEKLQKTNGIKFIIHERKIIVYDDTISK